MTAQQERVLLTPHEPLLLVRERIPLGADGNAGVGSEHLLDAGNEIRHAAERRHRSEAARGAEEEVACVQEGELVSEREAHGARHGHVAQREQSRLPFRKPADHEEVDVRVARSDPLQKLVPFGKRGVAVNRCGNGRQAALPWIDHHQEAIAIVPLDKAPRPGPISPRG